MNMKKTMAAVAASALAISAIAVPASAEVADAAVLGTKFTYSLVKQYDLSNAGSVQVQSQTTAYTIQGGFAVSLEGIDTNKEITISIVPNGGNGTPWNQTFILAGDGKTFIPAGITYVTDAFVNYSDRTLGTVQVADNDGTTDDFLVIAAGTAGFTGEAVITVKGTVKLAAAASDTNYATQSAATAYVNGLHTLKVYDTNSAIAAGTVVNTVADPAFDVLNTAGTIVTAGNVVATAASHVGTARQATGLVKPSIAKAYRPYKSSLNGSNVGAQDIIGWLQGDNASALPSTFTTDVAKTNTMGNVILKTGDGALNATNNYVNVQAVLNDCITSYDNVTFTFNTAKSRIFNISDALAASNDVAWMQKYNGFYTTTETVSWANNAYSTDKYMSAFGQSIYNNYGSDSSNFQPFDPNIYFNTGIGVAYNLFSGALVINDAYTMQLADTNVFTYNGTSLTFDYQSVKDNIYTSVNTYLDLIWSMKLATSVDWYWDSLDVAFAVDSGDTGESEAPVTEDDELIDDEITDAPVDEPTDELPEVLPEEPVAPAANPGTGNAPIALAVIPVALAAAAIIAKKRK